MKGNFFKRIRWLSVIVVILCISGLLADEGMWTFDNPPVMQLKKKYHFAPTQEWLDHVRLSSVRLMNGGSGSFVSPYGLVMTNHHVAVGQLQKLSSQEHDYVATGFLAKTPEEELQCPDLELNLLVAMENITDRVQRVLRKDMNDKQALEAIKAEIARVEKESLVATGLRSDVIKLYHGGEYWLYRYKKYTDVRLVFAPEQQAAYFGGDSDNFTYPRYCLDVAFFRVYEYGKPIKSEHYFAWNDKGAAENELVFVPGHPGSTNRLYTSSQLEYQRDHVYPMLLNYIDRRIRILHEYGKQGPEQERRALVQLFGIENAKKALTGEYHSLLDDELMAKRKMTEAEMRKQVANNPDWTELYGDAWKDISKVTDKQSEVAKQQFYRNLRGSRLASLATIIVKYVTEIQKPDAERLDGFHDAELEQLKFKLFSPAPIYADLEEATLAGTLKMSEEELRKEDEFLKIVLQDRSPEETANALISRTKLADVEYRKTLIEGGRKVVEQSDDPLIMMTRKLDPLMREQEEWKRKEIESVLRTAEEKISKARFVLYGKSVYPDATFTLRLAYGTVKGYEMNVTAAPYKTTLFGVYDRSLSFDKDGEFSLPDRFWDRQTLLNLATPVNFVSTCDIIGGNSGSPVINKDAEIVGLIFDGNIESLSSRFVYDETTSRAVSVHSAYITEALRKLYDANNLADEIQEIGTW